MKLHQLEAYSTLNIIRQCSNNAVLQYFFLNRRYFLNGIPHCHNSTIMMLMGQKSSLCLNVAAKKVLFYITPLVCDILRNSNQSATQKLLTQKMLRQMKL